MSKSIYKQQNRIMDLIKETNRNIAELFYQWYNKKITFDKYDFENKKLFEYKRQLYADLGAISYRLD